MLSDTSEGWTVVKRKRRNDATPKEHLKIACDFWASPGISRSTGNKKDIVRERIAANEYIEHDKQVMEMTQNEAFNEFKAKFPDVKMGQRTFENCKPFYVVPDRPQDRNSCCCRTHVETRMLFTTCINYRRVDKRSACERARLSYLCTPDRFRRRDTMPKIRSGLISLP